MRHLIRRKVDNLLLEYRFYITERFGIGFGWIDSLAIVPLKVCVIVVSNRSCHIGSVQLHVMKARVAILFPLRWKCCSEYKRWSFPKMPDGVAP